MSTDSTGSTIQQQIAEVKDQIQAVQNEQADLNREHNRLANALWDLEMQEESNSILDGLARQALAEHHAGQTPPLFERIGSEDDGNPD